MDGTGTPQVRVGDRERRVVDDRLVHAVGDGVLTLQEYDERAAVLWQARTRDELDALTADLPGDAPPAAAAPAAVPAATVRPQRVLAVMSEDRFAGALVPGQEARGYALMGKAVVDLRREDLPDGSRVRVGALMGEVEVQVPPGSVVHLSGLSLMGDRRVRVSPGDGPVVHVDAVAVMGSVSVTSGDGTVVPASAARPSALVRRPAAAPQAPHGRGHLSRVTGRLSGALVPAALLGGVLLAGPDARAVFGTAVERVERGDGSVAVSHLFGDVTVVVPDDSRVDVDGFAPFAQVTCADACGAPVPGGGSVDVRRIGAFGELEVLTQQEFADKQKAAADEQAEDAEDDD